MNEGFEKFKIDACNIMGVSVDDAEALCWEPIYDIVEGKDAYYMFDFENMALDTTLLLAATLLSVMHGKRVAVLEPTSYYAAQAIRFFRRWKIEAPLLCIGAAGSFDLSHMDAVFHHGRRFDHCEPVKQGARVIVQIFPGRDVPQDARPLSALMRPTYDD